MPRFDLGWLVLWGALSSAWCLSAAGELSATFDEPFYLRAGLTSWRTGSNRELMRAGTMPLPVDAQTLPIYLCERARGRPFELDRDFHTLLACARGVNLVFWWGLLAYGMLLARKFGGPWAGRAAVVLLATEPTLLAHASLATTDVALSALVLAFAYHFHLGRDETRFRRWVLPGFLYGLAMAAKVSALTFVPVVLVALETPRWLAARPFHPPPGVGRVRHIWRLTGPLRADAIKVFLVGMTFAWVYCGTDWEPHPKFVERADAMPDGPWTPIARWAAHRLAVFPNAGQAFHYQFKHNVRGHGAYLEGDWHRRAVWYYFPVALSIKLTLPVLALLAGLLVLRPRALLTPLGLAALLLLVFSLNCRVQIGIRLVFPLVVMLLLALGVGLARATAGWRPRGRAALLGCVTVACLGPAATAWPDGLRYGNELWGGPDETYRHLSDSNADWGQGVKDLDAWTAANGLPPAAVWYYGAEPSILYDPVRLLALHHLTEEAVRTPADLWVYVRGKVVAVSTSLLHGDPAITPTMPAAVAFFRGQEPVGRTRCYFVYDFREVGQ